MLPELPEVPFVSAFSLTYNHEDFIAEAVESVLGQGWPSDRFEYVVIDDGSTDATPERIRPYLDHLTYIRQENQGINAAVNRVMSLLRGDVIAACSGDDTWPPDRVERMVARLRAHPEASFSYGEMEVIDGDGRPIAPSFLAASKLTPHAGQIAGKLLSLNFIAAGSMALRGALLPVILPIPAAAAWEDWWFAWALTNVGPVDYSGERVYRYRRHGTNFVFGLSDEEKLLDRHADEVRFRRHMLGSVRPGTATLADLAAGVNMLTAILNKLEDGGRDPLPGLTDAERRAAERLAADAAAAAGRAPLVAAFGAARALAADPRCEAALAVLGTLAGQPLAAPAPPLADLRTVTLFADAEALAADPALAAAYTTAFGAGDDVTLMAVARGWDEARIGAELGPQFAGDDPPDVLAVPAGPLTRLSALEHADAALGPVEPFPGLPRLRTADELRAFVEHRWRFPRA